MQRGASRSDSGGASFRVVGYTPPTMPATLLTCPYCEVLIDGRLNPAGRPEPMDWDPCLCPGCMQVSTYDHQVPGGLRLPTQQDWDGWQRDPRLRNGLRIAAVAADKNQEPDEEQEP